MVSVRPCGPFSTPMTLRPSWNLSPRLLRRPLRQLGDFGVGSGQDAVEIFDHRHLGAEPRPDLTEFQPDDTGTDDHQPFGNPVECQRIGRIENVRSVRLQTGQRRRFGAGGDQNVPGRQAAATGFAGDIDAARRRDRRPSPRPARCRFS